MQGAFICGFREEEAASLQSWLGEMEPGFAVNCATDEGMRQSVQEAVYSPDGSEVRRVTWQQTFTLSPRICIFSGLSGHEQIAIIEAWGAFAGCPTPIFASVVPRIMEAQMRTLLQVR